MEALKSFFDTASSRAMDESKIGYAKAVCFFQSSAEVAAALATVRPFWANAAASSQGCGSVAKPVLGSRTFLHWLVLMDTERRMASMLLGSIWSSRVAALNIWSVSPNC